MRVCGARYITSSCMVFFNLRCLESVDFSKHVFRCLGSDDSYGELGLECLIFPSRLQKLTKSDHRTLTDTLNTCLPWAGFTIWASAFRACSGVRKEQVVVLDPHYRGTLPALLLDWYSPGYQFREYPGHSYTTLESGWCIQDWLVCLVRALAHEPTAELQPRSRMVRMHCSRVSPMQACVHITNVRMCFSPLRFQIQERATVRIHLHPITVELPRQREVFRRLLNPATHAYVGRQAGR